MSFDPLLDAAQRLELSQIHLRQMQHYLVEDRKRGVPYGYSEWKVKEALDWLWAAQIRKQELWAEKGWFES